MLIYKITIHQVTGNNRSETVIKELERAKDQLNIQCNADWREEGLRWPAAIPEENHMSNRAEIVTGHLCNGD